MQLFDKGECPFCWKVRLALNYKALRYQETVVDTDNKSEAFLAASPTGKVPVLIDGGQTLLESTLILHHLEDCHPTPTLLPGSVQQRDLARYLNHYSDTVIGPRIRDAIFTQRDKPQSEWDHQAIERSQQSWLQCLRELQALFTGPLAFTQNFSIAECALLPRFALASAYNLDGLDQYQDLKHWYQHHSSTDIFARALPPSWVKPAKT